MSVIYYTFPVSKDFIYTAATATYQREYKVMYDSYESQVISPREDFFPPIDLFHVLKKEYLYETDVEESIEMIHYLWDQYYLLQEIMKENHVSEKGLLIHKNPNLNESILTCINSDIKYVAYETPNSFIFSSLYSPIDSKIMKGNLPVIKIESSYKIQLKNEHLVAFAVCMIEKQTTNNQNILGINVLVIGGLFLLMNWYY